MQGWKNTAFVVSMAICMLSGGEVSTLKPQGTHKSALCFILSAKRFSMGRPTVNRSFLEGVPDFRQQSRIVLEFAYMCVCMYTESCQSDATYKSAI